MMNKEIKKELQEGMFKFVFEPAAIALSMIEKELKKILHSHGILDADVDMCLVNARDADATISFGGNIVSMRLITEQR